MFKVFVTKLEYPLLVVTTPEGKDYLSSRTVASFIAVKNSIEFEGIHEFNFIATRKEAEQLITDRILSSV